MGKCVVKECESRSERHKKSIGITYHKVPKDGMRRQKWVKIIRLLRKETDWVPTKSSAICSKHFQDEHKIIKDSGHIYLTRDATPMTDVESCPDVPVRIETEDMDEAAVETDDEINEITESPQMHEMRKIIDRLKTVSARRLIKIKAISQKNKRLEIKNKQLKEELEKLKNPVGRAEMNCCESNSCIGDSVQNTESKSSLEVLVTVEKI